MSMTEAINTEAHTDQRVMLRSITPYLLTQGDFLVKAYELCIQYGADGRNSTDAIFWLIVYHREQLINALRAGLGVAANAISIYPELEARFKVRREGELVFAQTDLESPYICYQD